METAFTVVISSIEYDDGPSRVAIEILCDGSSSEVEFPRGMAARIAADLAMYCDDPIERAEVQTAWGDAS